MVCQILTLNLSLIPSNADIELYGLQLDFDGGRGNMNKFAEIPVVECASGLATAYATAL